VADIHEGKELIDGEELAGPVAQRPRHIAGVIRERFRGAARLPATSVLQRLRQVPMVEGRKRFDAGFAQASIRRL
jgi:hypothetical protein